MIPVVREKCEHSGLFHIGGRGHLLEPTKHLIFWFYVLGDHWEKFLDWQERLIPLVAAISYFSRNILSWVFQCLDIIIYCRYAKKPWIQPRRSIYLQDFNSHTLPYQLRYKYNIQPNFGLTFAHIYCFDFANMRIALFWRKGYAKGTE